MTPIEAEQRLREMLNSANFDFEAPEPALAWSVFKTFASEPVEGVDDGFLWELGCYDFTGEKLCYLDFVRQFTFYEDGEYDHMEQLHIEFTAPPSSELLTLSRNRWSFDYPSLSAYFEDVEDFPEFHKALEQTPWKVIVRQEEV